MRTETRIVRIGEWLGPIDWSYDFAAHDWNSGGGANPEHVSSCVAMLRELDEGVARGETWEATTDGGMPRVGWGRVLRLGMYDGWPYWRPVPSVLIDGHLGAESTSFCGLSEIRRAPNTPSEPYLSDPDVTLYCGDALEVLRELPDESVHCVATSPPFYGLRDYGTGRWEGGDEGCDHAVRKDVKVTSSTLSGGKATTGHQREGYGATCGRCGATRIDQQIGLESTPEEWAQRLVEVFREARRVLRKDGTLWVEIGTSYASGNAPSRSRPPQSESAYDSDGRGQQGSPVADRAYPDSDGEPLAATQSHRDHTPRTVQSREQSELLDAPTDRDSERPGSEPVIADAAPLGVPASTTLASSPAPLDADHSPPNTDVASPSTTRSSVLDAPGSAHTDGYTNDTAERESAVRSQGTGAEGTAWVEYKAKDLILQPFLLAEALRRDGWYLRGVYIWSKPNCMPESAKDRCTTGHSYILHLSKSRSYFFDGDAISEPAAWERWGDQTVPKHEGTLTGSGWIPPRVKTKKPDGWDTGEGGHGTIHRNGREQGAVNEVARDAKHPRSVWTIPTQGFPEAHFATWPEALARKIILAACPEQVCSVCGKARERIVEVSYEKSPVHGAGSTIRKRNEPDTVSGWAGETMPRLARNAQTTGFTDCGHSAYVPGTVLDPFAGSGTTLYVARKLGRRGIGIDLNPEYLDMAARRLQQQSLFAEPAA